MEKTWQELGVLVILVVLFVVGVIAVFGLRTSVTKQPNVSVNLEDTTYTNQDTLSVTGKAENAKELTINDQLVQLDNNGNFSATVNLNDGNNQIKVVAKNGSKQADVTKTIVKESGQAVAGSNTGNQNQTKGGTANLNQSGPAEDIIGVIGLTSILLSLIYYFEKKRKVISGKYTIFS